MQSKIPRPSKVAGSIYHECEKSLLKDTDMLPES